jgi:hypothetical protein
LTLCSGYALRGDEPAAGSATEIQASTDSQPATESPAVAANPQAAKKPMAYWIEQLDSDQFLRRQAASKQLLSYGNEVVQPLVDATSKGRLELTERALTILQTLAIEQGPDDESGAWGALNKLSEKGSGSAAVRAGASLETIRRERETIAVTRLTAAGIKLGFREFVIDARSLNDNMVLIDSTWSGDLDALRWLRWIDKVAYVVIQGTAVNADVLAQVVLMPDLRTISLSEAKIDSDIFGPLSKMYRIDELEFRYIKLSAEDAEKIAKLPIRVQLSMLGTSVPREAETKLRDALPGLSIVLKEGGFLGVRCNSFSPVCQIDNVVEGGAAHMAGLEPGDVITEIDGTRIARFDDLQMEVGRHKPDEEIEITFDRRGEVKKVKLKLMRMNAE